VFGGRGSGRRSRANVCFLERLPIELRELVYEEVLAGGGRKLVHILRKRDALAIGDAGSKMGTRHVVSRARSVWRGG